MQLFPEKVLDDEISQAILCAFSILPAPSLQQCCYDILSFLREKSGEEVKFKNKLSLVVYLICIESLKAVAVDELFDMVFDESRNEYSIYLQVDAIIGRAVIYEILGEYSLAADDLSQLSFHVLDNVDSDIDKLKLSLQTSMIYALCHLPLVERAAGMHSESLVSFKRCISGDSVLKSRISSPMKTALTFSASMLLLQRARTAATEDDAQADVQTAFSLLQGLHATLVEEMRPSSVSTPMPLEHLHQSLVLKLPQTVTSPERVTTFASPSRIAILLSSISKRCNKSISNRTKLLEWGASFDVRLDLELLWSMANAHIDDDDVGRALPILEQAHNARMRFGESKQDDPLSIEFSNLVSWLNVGPHPVQCPWLPITRSVELYIDRLCKPSAALDFLLHYTKELYPTIFDSFSSLVDISEKLRVPHPDPLYVLMTEIDQGKGIKPVPDRRAFSVSFLTQNNEITENGGMLEILFAAGRALGCESRSLTNCRSMNRTYREAALTVMNILITHYRNIELSVASLPETLVLEYSVLLAENNEVSEATALVREAVRSNSDYGPLIHLLSLLLSHAGGSPEVYATATELCAASFEAKPLLSTGVTLALLRAEVEQLDKSVEEIDKIIAAIKGNMHDATFSGREDTIDPERQYSEETKSILSEYCLEWDRGPQSLRLSVEILVSGSRIYRKTKQLDKAKECTNLALKLLYTVNPKTITGFEYKDKVNRVELLRRIPQVSGWKLRDGVGFGAASLPDCEADIIAECAAQLMQETGDRVAVKELYRLALIDFPFHVPILLELADLALEDAIKSRPPRKLETDKWELPIPIFDDHFFDVVTRVKDELKSDSSSLTAALCHASQALRMNDESFDTWYTVGKVYEALGLEDQAKIAFWKAMALEPFDRVRKYDCVLLDSFC